MISPHVAVDAPFKKVMFFVPKNHDLAKGPMAKFPMISEDVDHTGTSNPYLVKVSHEYVEDPWTTSHGQVVVREVDRVASHERRSTVHVFIKRKIMLYITYVYCIHISIFYILCVFSTYIYTYTFIYTYIYMYMYDDQLICLDREKRTRPMALDPWKVTAPPRPWNLSRRLFSMGKHMEKISVDSSGEDTGFEQDNIHWIG